MYFFWLWVVSVRGTGSTVQVKCLVATERN